MFKKQLSLFWKYVHVQLSAIQISVYYILLLIMGTLCAFYKLLNWTELKYRPSDTTKKVKFFKENLFYLSSMILKGHVNNFFN